MFSLLPCGLKHAPFCFFNTGDGGAETQSIFSVPDIPGLNLKTLPKAYDVKAYVSLIAICPSDGDAKPGGPFDAFRKQ